MLPSVTAHFYGSKGWELESSKRGKREACPLRGRSRRSCRCWADTQGQPDVAIDLEHAGQRRHDNPVPKLIVRRRCQPADQTWTSSPCGLRSTQVVRGSANCLRSRGPRAWSSRGPCIPEIPASPASLTARAIPRARPEPARTGRGPFPATCRQSRGSFHDPEYTRNDLDKPGMSN
jgi:hypothetical protein